MTTPKTSALPMFADWQGAVFWPSFSTYTPAWTPTSSESSTDLCAVGAGSFFECRRSHLLAHPATTTVFGTDWSLFSSKRPRA